MVEAARAALERYGTCVSASRMVAGEIPTHQELERKLAQFCGFEAAALVFVSGHAADVSTIGMVLAEDDTNDHDALHVPQQRQCRRAFAAGNPHGFRHDGCKRPTAVFAATQQSQRSELWLKRGCTGRKVTYNDRFVDIKSNMAPMG